MANALRSLFIRQNLLTRVHLRGMISCYLFSLSDLQPHSFMHPPSLSIAHHILPPYDPKTMDPISGFSLAVGAMQLVEYAGKFIKTAVLLRKSPGGAQVGLHEIEAAAADLVQSIDILTNASSDEANTTLKVVCVSACDLANQLLQTIGTVTRTKGCGKWNIIPQTLLTIRTEHATKDMQSRLSDLRIQLITHLVAQSR
jgi:hypothetical protein